MPFASQIKAISIKSIPRIRGRWLDDGAVLIGIVGVAAATIALCLLASTESSSHSTAAGDKAGAAPMRIIGAATRGTTPCAEQTWPYIDRKCLVQVTDKRPSHGARSADLNPPPEPAASVRTTAPAPRDSFDSRFIFAAAAPSTDGVALSFAREPNLTRAVKPVREARPVRQVRAAGEAAAKREIRSDVVQSPDGRRWSRTTYEVRVSGGGTKQVQVSRPLTQQYRTSWGF